MVVRLRGVVSQCRMSLFLKNEIVLNGPPPRMAAGGARGVAGRERPAKRLDRRMLRPRLILRDRVAFLLSLILFPSCVPAKTAYTCHTRRHCCPFRRSGARAKQNCFATIVVRQSASPQSSNSGRHGLISREADRLIIEPMPKSRGLIALIDRWEPFDEIFPDVDENLRRCETSNCDDASSHAGHEDLSDIIRNPAARARPAYGNGGLWLAVSIIMPEQMLFGAAKRGPPTSIPCRSPSSNARRASFDVPADTEYASIRVELETAGKPIGPNDLLIAAHARNRGRRRHRQYEQVQSRARTNVETGWRNGLAKLVRDFGRE